MEQMIQDEPFKFTNESIAISDLPQFQTVDLNPLNKDYKKVMAWDILFSSLIQILFLGSIGFFILEGDPYFLLFLIPWSIWLIIRIFSFRISFVNKSYAIRTHDIIYQSGWIVKSQQVVPYSKIQHILLQEAWLSRKYKLANIRLYTTGDSMEIPGIAKETALQIQRFVLSKIEDTSQETEDNNETIDIDPLTEQIIPSQQEKESGAE